MAKDLCRLILFAALALLVSALPLAAQPTPVNKTPLLWGADPDGGIPYVFQDPEDPKTTIGFEMDLARALADKMGREIKFVKRSYESLFADLDRGDIDLAMNGLEIVPERLQRFTFSKPYYLYQLQLVARRREALSGTPGVPGSEG